MLRSVVELRLAALAPPDHRSNDLDQAIRYALLAPGKRIRPILTVLAYRELGRTDLAVLDAACALEMLHAASLVLDDLPAMDDALSRRGRPATHIAFGQDVAILASVSLIGAAFSSAARSRDLQPERRSAVVEVLAHAIGNEGLSAGQYADLRPGRASLVPETVAGINDRKTAALFVAAVEIAAAAAGATEARRTPLRRFASEIGQAFQLLDDLHDGADGGTGEDAGRSTLVELIGRAGVRSRIARHLRQAMTGLEPEGDLSGFVHAIFGEALAVEREPAFHPAP